MNQEQADKIVDAVMNCRNTLMDHILPTGGADPRATRAADTDAFRKVLDLINGAVK